MTPTMETMMRLEPIERPKGLMMRLAFRMTRRTGRRPEATAAPYVRSVISRMNSRPVSIPSEPRRASTSS